MLEARHAREIEEIRRQIQRELAEIERQPPRER
jgi:hypothetical protein